MLELKNVTKTFGGVQAVKGVSLSIPDGAFLVLLGPSGCGKTTLLRMLAGLEQPTGGQIAFGGRAVSDGDGGWSADPPSAARGWCSSPMRSGPT
jgi:iron(III) transport system ATP-binding protein